MNICSGGQETLRFSWNQEVHYSVYPVIKTSTLHTHSTFL